MIATASTNLSILKQASLYLNEKKYGIGKDPNQLMKELKKIILVRVVKDHCDQSELSTDLLKLLEIY